MANKQPGMIRTPVHRIKSERLILYTLLAFGGSVILTRSFLQLTGFPQLGGGGLHIAHVIWGGLFLFVATLLPLLYANNWALTWSAIAGGIGFGLFIDEVGKFITQSNDYFYPPAAPIVYALFLVTTTIYIHVRQPKASSPREELYHVLEGMTELLDHDLDSTEKAAIAQRLDRIRQSSDDAQLVHLADALDGFIQSEIVVTVPKREPKLSLVLARIQKSLEIIFTRQRMRWGLIIGLGIVGIFSIIKLVSLGVIIHTLFKGVDITPLIRPADTAVANQPLWFTIRLAIQGLVGLLSFAGAILFAVRRDRMAAAVAILGLTISLTVVNILIFYLDQFSAIFGAILELAILLGVETYRQRFLITPRNPIDPPVTV